MVHIKPWKQKLLIACYVFDLFFPTLIGRRQGFETHSNFKKDKKITKKKYFFARSKSQTSTAF